MKNPTCTSCKKRVINDHGKVVFSCPKCTQYEIVRCNTCRRNGTRYACPSCEFVGPN